MHRAASGLDSLPLADDSSRMAQIYMDQKNVPSAVGSLQTALMIRSKIAGPMDPSLVPISTGWPRRHHHARLR